MDQSVLSALEIDAVGEILNISLGSSATALSMLLRKRVEITIPDIDIVTKESFGFGQYQPAVGVEVVYVEGLEGSNIMLLKRSDVKAIYEIMLGGDPIAEEDFQINDITKSAVCEAMNQMMGSSATAMSDFLRMRINISTPTTFEVSEAQEFIENRFKDSETMVVGRFGLKIEDKVESSFLFLVPIKLCKELIRAFLPAGMSLEEEPVVRSEDMEEQTQKNDNQQNMIQQPALAPVEPEVMQTSGHESEPAAPALSSGTESLLLQQLAQQQAVMTQMLQQMQQMAVNTQRSDPKMIQTQNLMPQSMVETEMTGMEAPENLELIMGVPLEVTVEIGRARHLIKDILEFTKGSLVVLDKLAGEQVDLLVNGQLVAKGDVVVVEDNFGVRITEIVEKPEVVVRK